MSDSGQENVYSSGTITRQLQFPRRHTKVKPSRKRSPARAPRQSTLTQIEFCTPTSSAVVLETDSEDSSHSRKPRKKRRKLRNDKRQSTLTQLLPKISSDELDSAELLFSDDESKSIQETQYEAGSRPAQALTESSGPRSVPRSPQEDVDKVAQSPKVPRSATRRESSPIVPSTPKQNRRQEVPSSQTPQSMLFSARSRDQDRSPSRSQPSPTRFRKPALPPPKASSKVAIKRDPHVSDHRSHHHVVPDSQFDDLGAIITFDNINSSPGVPGTFLPNVPKTQYQSSVDDFTQYSKILDPACSALDRDASRYMYTQRMVHLDRADVQHKQLQAHDDTSSPPKQQNHHLLVPSETIDLTSTAPSPASLPSPTHTPPASPTPKAKIRSSQATTVAGTQPTFLLQHSSHHPSPVLGGDSSPLPEIADSDDTDSETQSRRVMHLFPNSDDENDKTPRRRAKDVLPDSLLEFTVPPPPVWSSSPLPVADAEEMPDSEGEGLRPPPWMSSPPPPSSSAHGSSPQPGGEQKSSGEGKQIKDYSLAPPSSGWRSSGARRSRPYERA